MAEATDTSERGLERLICTALAGPPCDPPTEGKVAEARPGYGGGGWSSGNPHDYDREFCVDRRQRAAFLHAAQPDIAELLALNENGPTRRKFLARLQGDAIRLKAEIMVDHFHDQVIAKNKIGGAARAMVVTNGIPCRA